MGLLSKNGETESLLKNKIQNVKWNRNHLKWIFCIIILFILLLGAVYILFSFFKDEIQPPSNEIIKAKNPLHVSSVATTNDDYLKQYAPVVNCDANAKYRSINGSCNNLAVPTWGAALTPVYRLLNANFSDGYYKLRVQTNGSDLPSARVIDLQLFLDREKYRVSENNVLLVPFAQLIAHDISGIGTDVPKDENGQVIDCCENENARETFAQCATCIDNPPDDPVYGEHNISCMVTVRSLTSRNYSISLYPTTFINTITHYVDGSEVYGSSESVANRLRIMQGGRLNFTTNENGQMFCPFLARPKNEIFELNPIPILYDTGNPDNGNQNIGITAMQTLLMRFHNYVAFRLLSVNPNWSDEEIYQEARRIVIATIQRITYENLLPIIIGEDYLEMYGINKENIYDSSVNPSMSQEFSSAALRAIHNIIPVQFNFMNKDYKTEFAVNITDWIPNPFLLHLGNNFDKLIKGFLETPGRISQPSYNYFLSNFIFYYPHAPIYTGRDLLAIDIMRGRDVGLQPYNQVRHFCGLPLAKGFEDLLDLMHIKDINKLKELYNSVNDIDLIVGMLLEKNSDDAIVGPTARCIIADGFYRFKVADRFFYDVKDQPGSFTPEQMKVIKKISLGHVLCATTDLDHVQTNIFKTVDHTLFPTSKLKCDDEFHINFKDWTQPNNRSEL